MRPDPLEGLFSSLRRNRAVMEAIDRNWLSSTMLNKTGSAYELHGLEATRLWLIDKKSRAERTGEMNALLAALECFRQCPAVLEQRQVGRIVLKTLRSIGEPDRQHHQQPQRRRP